MPSVWVVSRKILTGLLVMAALALLFVGIPIGIIQLLEYYQLGAATVAEVLGVPLVLYLAYMIGDADDKMQ